MIQINWNLTMQSKVRKRMLTKIFTEDQLNTVSELVDTEPFSLGEIMRWTERMTYTNLWQSNKSEKKRKSSKDISLFHVRLRELERRLSASRLNKLNLQRIIFKWPNDTSSNLVDHRFQCIVTTPTLQRCSSYYVIIFFFLLLSF